MQKRAMVFALSVVAALMLVTLAGCAAQPAVKPAGEIDGYYASTQKLRGGKVLEDANLSGVELYPQSGDLVLQLAFSKGSLRGDTMLSAPPAPYTLEMWSHPARLVVTLEGIRYWDYTPNAAWSEIDYVQGVLLERQEDCTRFILQLSERCEYKTEESDTALRVQLRPVEAETAAWVVALEERAISRAESYSGGGVVRGASSVLDAFTPALCADGFTRCWVSDPYIEEAEAARLLGSLTDAARENAQMVCLPGELAFTPQALEAYARQPVLYADSGNVYGEPWAMGGRFLCWNAQSGIFSFPVAGQSPEEDAKEMLCCVQPDGKSSPLLGYELSTIAAAKRTQDGRFLGLIEQTFEQRRMLLYDMQSQQLRSVAEEGFGSMTADFAFSSLGLLYAATGDNGMLQCMEYDPLHSADEGTSAVRIVEERPLGFGTLEMVQDRLLALDEAGEIVRIDPRTGERAHVVSGNGFCVSPNGRYCAVSDYSDSAEWEDAQTLLRVGALPDGPFTVISEGSMLMNMVWSRDGSRLFYLTADAAPKAQPYTLWEYAVSGGATRALGFTEIRDFFAGADADELIFVKNVPLEDGGITPLTLRVRIP